MRTMKRAIGILTIAAALFVACAPGAAQSAVGNFVSLYLNGNRLVATSGTATVTIPNTTQTLIGTSTLCTTGGWCKTTTTLTDAQTKALPTTGIVVVAAPGAGSWVRVLGVSYASSFAAGAYTNIDTAYADLQVNWGDYAGGYVANDNTTTPVLTDVSDFLGSTTKKVIQSHAYGEPNGGYLRGTAPLAQSGLSNAALYVSMTNGSGNLTGGNAANTLKVTVYYSVEAL